MSEYLMPHTKLNISEKKDLFAVKNRMTDISANFPSGREIDKCLCNGEENNEHIYTCKLLNKEQIEISYKELYNGSIENQIMVYKRFRKNMDERENMKNENYIKNLPHVTPVLGPQSSDYEHCNGFHK